MNIDLKDVEFVIFDAETTGLSPEWGDRIIEIGAIRIKDGKKISEFSSLVNPRRDISPGAFAVNNISYDMVKDAPDSGLVLPEFLKFVEGSCLAAYNTNFDLGFINNEIKPLGIDFPDGIPVIDILIMARRLLPELRRYSLWRVAQNFGIDSDQEHRALSDVNLTADVFARLMAILKKKRISGFANFLNLFGVRKEMNHPLNQQKMSSIQRAIDQKTNLKIKYFSSSRADVSEREITPKLIKKEARNDVVVGYCHLRKEERSFRLERILHMEML